MSDIEQYKRSSTFKIYLVRVIDDVSDKVEETYITGIKDFIFVPINEAKRAIERRLKNGEDNNYYIATDNKDIAEQYRIKFIKFIGMEYK